jgi:hypothetical protein
VTSGRRARDIASLISSPKAVVIFDLDGTLADSP